jgi:hypothetical protein
VTNGASLQWLEVLWNPAFSNLTLTLQGPDTGMLAEAAGWVRKLEQLHGVVFPVAYVLTPLEDLADAKKQPDDEGVFQFIFALGLLDSQIDRRAKAVIRTLYRWLCPGGELVLTNAVSDNPDQQVSEYWNDSRIYDRSEKQCLDLVSNLGDSNSVLSYDISKIEMMLRVAKPDLVKHEYFSVV